MSKLITKHESTTSAAVARMTETALMFMELSQIKTNGGKDWAGKKFDISRFDGAVPFFDDETLSDPYFDDDRWLIPADATLRDLSEPLNITFLTENTDEENGIAGMRLRAMSPKQARGRVRRYTPQVVDLEMFVVEPDGRGVSNRMLLGSFDGETFACTDSRYAPDKGKDAYWTQRVRLAAGLQFVRPMWWHVKIGYVGGQSILLPTDPIGAREIFRLRDVPEGKERRAALTHWISEHWRQARDEPEEETLVRASIRGASSFVWNGLRCEILPATDDLAKLERLKHERKQRKKDGTDRRERGAA